MKNPQIHIVYVCFRIKIPEQKGLGGLHLSVNYKKKSWKQIAMDPLLQVKKNHHQGPKPVIRPLLAKNIRGRNR